MDQPRGRSPSQGNRQHVSPMPSPHSYHENLMGVDPNVQQALTSGKFSSSPSFQNSFLATQQPVTLPSNATDSNFYSSHQYNQGVYQDDGQFSNQVLDPQFNANNDYLFQNATMSNDWSDSYPLETTFNMNQQNVNPADLSKVSSPHDHQSPNLLQPENHSSPGPQAGSPSSTNGPFYTPQHSRHTSLDPASAYGDSWQGTSFTGHRRAPSDHSDVSSASHSPFLGHQELHEGPDVNHSPFMTAQQDTGNTFGIDAVSLAEQEPYRSPRLMPHMDGNQQGLQFGQPDLLSQAMSVPHPEIFTSQAEPLAQLQSNHLRNTSLVSDMGQADQFAPPIINIEPAPVSRQASFGPQGEHLEGTLSPPSRSRTRSKSDVTFTRPMSRSVSPGRSPPMLKQSDSLSVRSPSPSPLSRESSPGLGSNKIDKNRRASTSSIASRDYILDLADPSRPTASPSGSNTRVQKHPANFQCTLCPKKFTRAYNLRSHLRTHTDERPFVCTVCSKAFARQHDRKRHEGLHSGEKKFVCKGELRSSPGQHWGCGRRFARADALGRHFRSEAGRVCIKPLLDEEAAERRNKMMMMQQHHQQQQQQQQHSYAPGGLQPMPQSMMMGMDSTGGAGGFALPAALLAQYPALQNIDWSQMSGADDPGELSDVGMGGAGFDGSSGGEYYDDELSEGYVSGNGMNFSNSGQQMFMGN